MIRSSHRIVVCALAVLRRGSAYASLIGPSGIIEEEGNVPTVAKTIAADSVAAFDGRHLEGQQARDNNSLPKHMQHKVNLHAQAAKKLAESGSIGKSIGLLKQNNKCHDDVQSTPSGYRCLKMDLEAFVSNAELGSRAATEYFPFGQPLDWISDIWGYISPKTKKRYAITGHWDGTSFVDLTIPNQPAVLGFMETSGNLAQGDDSGIWRDIKVVNDFAYVGSEIADHGVQVFDVKLLDSLPRPSGRNAPTRGDVPRLLPTTVIGDKAIGSSHNIVSFEEEGKVLVVGIRTGKQEIISLVETGIDVFGLLQSWSASPNNIITAPIVYGDGEGGNLEGCTAFAPGSLEGKIVLVDRGSCFFSEKVRYIAQAGGLAGIVGFVAPGNPYLSGSGSEEEITIPGYLMSQEYSNEIKAYIMSSNSMVVSIDPDNSGYLPGEEAYCDITAGESVVVLDVSSDPLNPPYKCLELGSSLNNGDHPFTSYPGYVHDADCFIYKGPDKKYYDLPLCVFYAESEIGIFDMRNEAMISTFTYDGVAYAHQGGVSSDFSTLYSNDEVDELCDSGLEFSCTDNSDEFAYPNTRIFDVTSLENVGVAREFKNANAFPSADHNLYVQDDHIFSAVYQAGARVYKILSDKSLEDAAFFEMVQDCSDLLNCAAPLNGVWTHYPYPDKKSTTIAGSIYLGLFAFGTRLDEPKEQMSVDACQHITKRKKCEKMDGCSWDMSEETCVDESESLGEGVALGTAGTLEEAVVKEPRSAGWHAKASSTLAWAMALAWYL